MIPVFIISLIISSKFAGKVELDVFKIDLRHLQYVGTVGQEDIPSFAIFGHGANIVLFYETEQ